MKTRNQQHRPGPGALPLITALCSVMYVTSANAWRPPVGEPWGDAEPVADTDNSVQGGCPIESPNGRYLYMASSRDGGLGALDIWRAKRKSPSQPYGPAENLGSPVNSDAADFCPTPLPGNILFFVSSRPHEDACGGSDIYVTRWSRWRGWLDPINLGCEDEGGPNSAGSEFAPSVIFEGRDLVLYFSSDLAESGSGQDLYRSVFSHGRFGPREPVTELNTEFSDFQPNVLYNGREIVFASNRPGGEGGADIWTATRNSVYEPWGPAINVGPGINAAGDETRPSLSWSGTRLLFGTGGEIYVSER